MSLRRYRDRDDEIINNINTLRHNAQACISCIEFTEQCLIQKMKITKQSSSIIMHKSVWISDNFFSFKYFDAQRKNWCVLNLNGSGNKFNMENDLNLETLW